MAKKKETNKEPMQNEQPMEQPMEQPVEQQQEPNIEMMARLKALQDVKQIADVQNQAAINTSHDVEANAKMPTPTLNVIGKNEIDKAYQTLLKYKEEKTELEKTITENEEFWKMNHWDVMNAGAEDNRIKPKSGWLFNTIINKHADAMDNYPNANILPRARDDEEVAKALSSVIPVILEQNDYEATYSSTQWYKAKNGASAQAVLWNNSKNNGLGDVEIKKVDLLNLFWKGGITDIQDSPNLFCVTMMENDLINELYPEVTSLGSNTTLGLTTIELYNTGADTSKMTAVIDWYYKKRKRVVDEFGVAKTDTILHYCKFCNGEVIYASENDPNYAESGWYNHGKYPFVIDTLFPVEGSIVGMGYIDVIKDDQLYIDKLQQAILESAVSNARPRFFIRNDGSINEDEFLDLSKPVVHTDGNLGEDAIRAIGNTPFSAVYESVYLNKINELKDTSGNTATSQGGASSVTAASGIAALQEAAGKLSRDSNATSYRAYKQVVYFVIELIRQFYNEPRCFRITGEDGKQDFVTFDNSGLLPQNQGNAFGLDLGSRLPIVDIDVKPQKRSAYTKESQNQTALNLYGMGFFTPTNADASLACLNMMDFDGIEKVKDQIAENGTLMQMVMALQQQLMQLGAIVDAQNGTNIVGSMTNGAQATSSSPKKTSSTQTSKGSQSSQAAATSRSSTTPNQ